MPPDSGGLDYSVETPDRSPTRISKPRPSPRVMGPLTMRDAYSGTESDRALIDTILFLEKKPQVDVSIKKKFDRCEAVKMEQSDGISHDSVKGVVKDEYLDYGIKIDDKETESCVDVWSMGLKTENIARVLPGRIMAVRFLPCNDVRMIVAGNKFGNVAFWNMDSKGEEGDGIFLYRHHTGPISGILCQQSCLSKIYTSCYDGFLRLMNAEKEVFDLVYSGRFSSQWILHEDRINSIDFNSQNPNIMATSSTDGTACLWDLRSVNADKAKSLKILNHNRAVHSAYFSPSGSFLATTSADNTVGILGGVNFEDTSMIYHYNQTGRWLSPFRGIWGWDDSSIFIGNMKRGVDVISCSQRRSILTLQSSHMSAIPCRFDAHPCKVGMLAGATSGGQVYVWTSS
ncbi:hypothetical protein GH714_011589 [Hevea brasiliensis]|uniref:Uncharacterized protein n=1 Tax=Hevea brasiliensis TaxID=3981 RepID=A0A6A6MXD6_HEVBR|nr:hypothetical protein GH714_011589 [Hevea brasiliensis]